MTDRHTPRPTVGTPAPQSPVRRSPVPEATTTTVEVAGRPVRIRRSGPAQAPPVVLLHGIGRSLEDWSAVHELLAEDHRVLSMDLPGFGLTPAGTERPGLGAFARAVVGVLDALGEERPVHLMGNSLGGAVAMTVAAEHPGRVAGLLLADSAGFGREANVSALPMVWAALSRLPVVGPRFRPLARAAAVRSQQSCFFDPSLATPERLRHAARVGAQPDFRATFLGTYRSIGLPVIGVLPGWRRALLAKVRAAGPPVLVVWGDADAVLPAHHAEAAAAALPEARLHVFPDTGHMPQIERTQELVELAREFVASAERSRSAR
ncbi:alpha/beta fold hydrolase [Kocuria sp. NPDC057446]|uniref:alpha/beta fold hydrolase n=1 Tax=Kocuria sp. NPDC057446 TaxID=3346137 RepID=UPI003692E9E4